MPRAGSGGAKAEAATSPQPGPHHRRERRREQARKQHSDAAGNVRADLWRAGIQHIQQMPTAAQALAAQKLAPAPHAVPATGVWSQVGPAALKIDAVKQFMGEGPVAGQVTGIAIDPSGTEDKVVYIATNDGGIWKSTDGGSTWQPKTDTMPSLSMGAIELDPGNSQTVYAGTGNLYGNWFFKGVGLYKSTDGGDKWEVLNPGEIFTPPGAEALGIRKIVLPATGVLLVATNGGLFRSVDGGAHFGANSPKFDDGKPISIEGTSNGDITDLAIDTTTSTTVYVAVAGKGLFKFADKGATFTAEGKLWPTPVPEGGLGNVVFAQSGSADHGQTMYISATVDTTVGATQYLGFFKSTKGSSFSAVAGTNAAAKAEENTKTKPPSGSPQVGYDHVLAVDPRDASRVYLCFQEVYVSTDGGVHFGKATAAPGEPPMTGNSHGQAHWDNHALTFSPPSHVTASPTRVWVGNDGGLVRSDDGGEKWTNLNEGVATCLFLGIDIGRGNALNNLWTYGGCQDNGTIEHRDDSVGMEWHLTFNGDGGKVAVDPKEPKKAYGSSNGQLLFTTDGGLNWTDRAGEPHPIRPRVTCVAVDPNNSSNIFFGLDASATGEPAAEPQLCFSNSIATTFSVLTKLSAAPTSIAIAPTDSKTIYVSLEDGTVQKSTDGGSKWEATTATGAGAHMAAEQVVVDPGDANRIAAVYSGHSGIKPSAARTKHVFLSTDGGAHWADASGTDGGPENQNLPDLPLRSVVFDPGTSPNHAIIVAGDGGVLQSLDNGASWHRLGTELPNAECRSLALDPKSALLRVGTYGRSVFQLVGTPPPTTPGATTPPPTTPAPTTPAPTTPPPTTPAATTPPPTTPAATTPPPTTPAATTPPPTTPSATTPPPTTPPPTTPGATTPPPTTPAATTPPPTTPAATTPPPTTPGATTPPPTTPAASEPPPATPPPTTPPPTPAPEPGGRRRRRLRR